MNVVYTVHFQKGTRVGTRSTIMVPVPAPDAREAIAIARSQFYNTHTKRTGWRIVRVDHFDDNGRIERDA